MANRKRTHNISFRANDEERDLIERKRALTGLSMRCFIISCITSKSINVKPGAPLVAVQIARVGNNLNQLTRHLNSGYLPSACGEILQGIRQELREIRQSWQS